MAIRLCHAGNMDRFFALKLNKKYFEGDLGEITSDFIKFTHRISNNSVIIDTNEGQGVGEKFTNGSYSGCIGKLQVNTSDMLFYTVNYPLDAENLQQGFLLFDEFMVIGQDYFLKNIIKDGQVFDVIFNCHSIIWLILFFFISVILLVILRQSIFTREKYNNCIHDVITHSLRINCIRDTNLFYRLLFFSLSIFSLIVIHYNNSLIKTSLVVIKDPDLFYSYAEIIDKKIKPFFIKGLNSHEHFKNAPANSILAKVWNYSISNWSPNELFVPPSPNDFLKYGIKMAARREILIIDSILAKVIRFSACTFRARNIPLLLQFFGRENENTPDNKYRLENFHFHSVVDESERPFIKSIVFSAYFTSPLAVAYKRHIRYSIEQGLTDYYLNIIQNADIFAEFDKGNADTNRDLMESDPNKLDQVRNCASDTIVSPHVSFVDEIAPVNLAKLLAVCFIMMAVSTILLMIEVVVDGIHKEGR